MRGALLWTFDRPLLIGALLIAGTVLFGLQVRHVEIDPSPDGLMVEHDPARDFYEQVKRRFGSDTLTVVLVKADDIYTSAVLAAIKRLTDGLERLDGVSRVESLTTVKNIKGEKDTVNTEPLIGAGVPADPGELHRIRRDAQGNRVFVGNIVSPDGRATAITIYTDPRPRDDGFNQRFTDQVEALIKEASAPGLAIYQIGGILTKVENYRYIEHDQRVVVPIGIAVVLIVLWFGFWTPQAMLIPTTTSILTVVWALGLMAMAGIPLNLLTSSVPPLLIAIGFTEDVYLISEYHERLQRGLLKVEAIRDMLQEAALPLLITALTTVLGFATLLFTDITMLIQFGVASCLGLTANFVVTILLAPLMLRLLPVPRHLRRSLFAQSVGDGFFPRLMDRLGHFDLRYRGHIAVIAGLMGVASLIGWWSLRVDTDFVSLFPRDSLVRQRLADFDRALGGGLNFSIVVDTGREDGVKDPNVLRRIAGLQDFLEKTGKVAKSVSVADYLRKMNREMNGGDPAFEVVPDSADLVAQYLLLLEGREFEKFIDFNASGANVIVRHNLTGSRAISGLRTEIEGHIKKEFPPHIAARPTGEAILINNAVDYLAINALTSLSQTFVVIALIHSALFWSLKAGLLSMVPNALPVLTVFGLMGLVGIPLNIATAMIATIAIGIAVDDTVHYMVAYSRQLQEHHDQRIAMFNTLRSQGRPIICVSLALTASFCVFLFSNLTSTVYLGLLAGFVMIMAMLGELTLTPILMNSTQLVTVWDLLLLRMRRELVRGAPLFQELSQWEVRKVVLLGRLQSVPVGAVVIRKGDSGDEMFMVLRGRLRVFDRLADGRETLLYVLEPGTVFGEMALLTRQVRTAFVAAETNAEMLCLDFAALERIRKRFPFTGAKLFRNLARILTERLQHTTGMLVARPVGIGDTHRAP